MHELAHCVVVDPAGEQVLGYVRTFAGGVMVAAVARAGGWEPGHRVDVVVLDEVRGECRYRATVVRALADAVVLERLELESTSQKRTAARVRTHVRCTGTWTPGAEGSEAVRAGTARAGATEEGRPEAGRTVDLTVIDISAGGCRFSAHAPVPEGALVRFVFPGLDAPVDLTARVLRTQPQRTTHHHACRFEDAPPEEVEALYAYVLRTQGAQRRRLLLR